MGTYVDPGALFPRAWRVQVDNLNVSNLDIEFKILRTIKSQPSKCLVTIWNLNPEHRAQLLLKNRPNGSLNTQGGDKAQGVYVKVEAGYVGQMWTLFSGDLREVSSTRQGTDWRTTISGDDGGNSYREARFVNGGVTFAKGTRVTDVLTQAAKAMGIGIGNVAGFADVARLGVIGSTIPHAMTLSGPVPQGLNRLCNGLGITWSIQGGSLLFADKGAPTGLTAIVLSPATGLLDSPEASVDATVSLGNPQAAPKKPNAAKPPKPKSISILKVRAMLIPGLVPSRKIQLQSAAFNGNYYATECEYQGQTWAKPWHVDMITRVY